MQSRRYNTRMESVGQPSAETQRDAFLTAVSVLEFLFDPEVQNSRRRQMIGLRDSAIFYRFHGLLWCLDEPQMQPFLTDDEKAAASEFKKTFNSLSWQLVDKDPEFRELPDDDLSAVVPSAKRLLELINVRICRQPEPRRRWFRFSLRTLLVAVMLAAAPLGWVGWQANIARERVALLTWVTAQGGDVNPDWPGQHIAGEINAPEGVTVSWVRRMLGDRPICSILIQGDPDSTAEDRIRIRAMFPESTVTCPGFDTDSDPPGDDPRNSFR